VSPQTFDTQWDDLARLVKGEVFADVLHRAAYSSDASIYQIVPSCVVFPRNAQDIAAVVKYAEAKQIPVAARGAGSGLAGESLTSGILLDVTRYMNGIISIENEGELVTCEPGVVLDELNAYLAKFGRKIGPDPSSSNRATIGGVFANNSTGAHSLAYGYIADYVTSVEAVLADGSIVEFRNNLNPADIEDKKVSGIAQKCLSALAGKEDIIAKSLPTTKRNRCGYGIANISHNGKIDLAKLMAGSEGTLAIFTKITLRTVELPAIKALLQLEFDSLDKMAKAVPIIVASGVATCDVMDKNVIKMAIESLPEYRDILPGEAEVVLLIEHSGDNQKAVQEKIDRTDLAVGNLASGRSVFFDPIQQKRVWKSRKDAVPLLYRIKSKKHPVEFIEDISVDNTKLAEYLAGLEKIKKKYNVSFSCYGHAGDGELHIRPNLDLGEQGDIDKMKQIANEVFALAWSLGGTVSGEHAVGLVRAAFLRKQYGDEFYNLLCGIKKIFDPAGLFNPGKIINDNPNVMVENLKAGHHIKNDKTFAESGVIFADDEISLELEQCSGCGVCRSREQQFRMCPLFRTTGDELASSRAKMNVLRFWSSGQLKEEYFESPEFRRFLDLCINCKACSIECPSGVDVSKIIAAARAEYVRRKGLRLTERLLSHNRYLSMLASAFAPISNSIMRLPITRWLLEKTIKLDSRRRMPKFAFGSFASAGRLYLETCKPSEMPIDKVAYFLDSYVNYNDHELGFAVIDVLRHNSVEVIIPKQRPAPLPAIVYGDVKTAKKDLSYSVKYLAAAVKEGYKIICSEPSAALCLRQELQHYVDSVDAKIVSENTYELMEYLRELLRQGKLNKPKRTLLQEYVYHTPCHLFATGAYGASIELLQKLCNIPVADLKAGCCGLAGTFGMQQKNYELSEQIANSLKDALNNTSAQYVLTECAACGMQIEHVSGKHSIHPIKVLAKAYGPMREHRGR
jgi:anaerobic glycerol-3-phosphate dehydrogenase C subunit